MRSDPRFIRNAPFLAISAIHFQDVPKVSTLLLYVVNVVKESQRLQF